MFWLSSSSVLHDQPSWKKVYNQSRHAVYLVQCGTRKGAGFMYKDRRHVITSLHVAGCGRTVWLKPFGDKKWVAVSLKAYINKYDVALLEAPKPLEGTPLRTAPKDSLLEVGTRLAVIGHPYKTDGPISGWLQKVLSWTVSTGIVGRINKESFQVNMQLLSGFAGGPLLDLQGRLRGMMTHLGPQNAPIGIALRPEMFTKLFAKDPPRLGWPFFSLGVHLDARFSFALSDSNSTRISPTSQELRLDLIFWDQFICALSVGFDLLAPAANLDLSFLFGLDLHYRFLMPRQSRPYLNYVSVGLGAMAMRVKLLIAKKADDQTNFNDLQFNGLFRFTFWGGIRLYSLIGQISVGVYFDLEDIQNPVLSVSWGFGS